MTFHANEHFRCEALRCTLTRADCGQRFRTASKGTPRAAAERKAAAERNDSLCANPSQGHACPIGKLHAAGKDAPDVELRQLVPHSSAGPPPRPAPLPPRRPPRPAPEAPARRRGRTPTLYRVGNRELSIAEWARATGISRNTIYRRMERGWPMEAALTTPKGGMPPAQGETKKGPAPTSKGRQKQESTPAEVLEFLGFEVTQMCVPGGWVVYVQEGAAS